METQPSAEEQDAASKRLLTLALATGDGQVLLAVKMLMDARDAALASLVEIEGAADAWLHGESPSAAQVIVQIGGIAERAITQEPSPARRDG